MLVDKLLDEIVEMYDIIVLDKQGEVLEKFTFGENGRKANLVSVRECYNDWYSALKQGQTVSLVNRTYLINDGETSEPCYRVLAKHTQKGDLWNY